MSWKPLIIFFTVLFTIAFGAASCESLSPPSSSPALSQTSGIFNQQNTGIWVTGKGKVSVVPDVAVLNLGVEAQAESVAEAQSQAATAMAAVVAELDRFGIDDKDIKTQYFSIAPVRRWSEKDGQEILVGYRVTNTVTVKVRNIDDTGPIIDAAAAAGGDYIRINNISFTVEDPSAYYDDARAMAMADAWEKAEQLADLADVRLGKPTYISESTVSTPVVKDFYPGAPAPAPAAPTTSITPGETEISISVQVTYSIE
jgi:uncharacterized protein YggE